MVSIRNDGQAPKQRSIVLDTAALIAGTNSLFALGGIIDAENGGRLQAPAPGEQVTFYTTPDVIHEVRDKRARARLALLQDMIVVRPPSSEAVASVISFAKATGDYSVLSLTDLRVIALCCMLEIERDGGSSLRNEPQQQSHSQIRIGKLIPFAKVEKMEREAELKELERLKIHEENGGWTTIQYSSTNTRDFKVPLSQSKNTEMPKQDSKGKQEKQSTVEGTKTKGKRRRHPARKPKGKQLDTSEFPIKQAQTSEMPVNQSNNSEVPVNQSQPNEPSVSQSQSNESPVSNSQLNESPANHSPINELPATDHQLKSDNSCKGLKTKRKRTRKASAKKLNKLNEEKATANENDIQSQDLNNDSISAKDSKIELGEMGPTSGEVSSNSETFTEHPEHSETQSNVEKMYRTANQPEVVDMDGDDDDDDDGEGWINLSNLEEHLAHDAKVEAPSAEDEERVGCVTTDFAMQNTMLQMGLKILTVDGRRTIRKIRHYALRCSACGVVTRELGTKFCDKCGNFGLHRVAFRVSKDGVARAYLNPKKRPNTRGTKYPIPKTRGGRHNTDLILRADQVDATKQRRIQKRLERQNVDVLDPTTFYNAGARFNPNEKPLVVGYGRRNPNEVRKSRKK